MNRKINGIKSAVFGRLIICFVSCLYVVYLEEELVTENIFFFLKARFLVKFLISHKLSSVRHLVGNVLNEISTFSLASELRMQHV